MIWVKLMRWAPHALLVIGLLYGASLAADYGRTRERAKLTPELVSLRAEVDYARARAQAEEIARKRAEKALDAYHAELLDIRTRPVPAAPVRLCRNPAARLPATPAATGGVDGTATAARGDAEGAGGDSGEGPGPDIGPDLAALAASCDVVSARLRALQGWASDPR